MRKNDHRMAKTVWFLGVLAFAAPALAGWVILGLGHAEGCAFGAAACAKIPQLGEAFKRSLDFAWLWGTNGGTLVPTATIVGLASILARSPLRAFVGVFVGPSAALLLPVLVVGSALYPGCTTGGCTFWGVAMGDAFTAADIAPWLAYIIPPVGFAAALAVTLVAFIIKRQRA
jgi:hypothetical protein